MRVGLEMCAWAASRGARQPRGLRRSGASASPPAAFWAAVQRILCRGLQEHAWRGGGEAGRRGRGRRKRRRPEGPGPGRAGPRPRIAETCASSREEKRLVSRKRLEKDESAEGERAGGGAGTGSVGSESTAGQKVRLPGPRPRVAALLEWLFVLSLDAAASPAPSDSRTRLSERALPFLSPGIPTSPSRAVSPRLGAEFPVGPGSWTQFLRCLRQRRDPRCEVLPLHLPAGSLLLGERWGGPGAVGTDIANTHEMV